MRSRYYLLALSTAALTACTTVPQAPPAPIVIDTAPIQTCVSVAALTKVVIPAETKTQTAITEVDNPGYEPIQSRVTRTIVVKPAQIIYVDSNNQEVIDICESVERGETGPGAGEVIL